MLLKYVEIFKTKSSALVESLRPASDTGQTVNVIEYVLKSNLDGIVGEKLK